jgi:hypothetical protein
VEEAGNLFYWPRKLEATEMVLTLEQRAAFVEEAPEIFLPIPGGWGKMGRTHIRLAAEWPISNAGRDDLGGRQERVSLWVLSPETFLKD